MVGQIRDQGTAAVFTTHSVGKLSSSAIARRSSTAAAWSSWTPCVRWTRPCRWFPASLWLRRWASSDFGGARPDDSSSARRVPRERAAAGALL